METRRKYGRFIGGRLLVSGLAAVAVLGGSFEASSGQAPALGGSIEPTVIAQQVIDVPDGLVAFLVTEQTVSVDGVTIADTNPGFLVGASGSALVEAKAHNSTVLLGPGEATALAKGDSYSLETSERASLVAIELLENPPDTAFFMSNRYSDLAGQRDMELSRAELGQEEQLVIESESGAGVLVVAESSALVEDIFGETVQLGAGEAISLDDSNLVTGADSETVVLAVTLGKEIPGASKDKVSGSENSGSGASNGSDSPGGSNGGGQPGNSVPVVQVDTDGDGLYDDEEAAYGSDPNTVDSDQDELSDGEEVHVYGSSPTSNDTDGDGLPDYNEVMQQGTDPANPDTDGDGLNDHDELGYEGANPTMYDSDGDDLNDLEEVLYGGSSETSDYDGDGLTDYEEAKVYGTLLYTPDSDGDLLGDYNEVTDFGTDPNDADTDDDGYTDGFEINDGYDPFDPTDPGPMN